MDYKDRIIQLQKQGKINKDQARSLLASFETSEKRQQKIKEKIKQQKSQREKSIWHFVMFYALLLIVFFSLFFTIHAFWRNLNQSKQGVADEYIRMGLISLNKVDYQTAVASFQKSMEKIPPNQITYTLLGVTYNLLYSQTKEETWRQLAEEMNQNALELSKINTVLSGPVSFKGVFFFGVFILLITTLIAIVLSLLYNRLVQQEERVNESWAMIRASLQHKSDLLPALLDIVKQHSQHEEHLFYEVTKARSTFQNMLDLMDDLPEKDQGIYKAVSQYDNILKGNIEEIKGLVEAYPDLKSDNSFVVLLQQIEEMEARILDAKKSFNQTVKKFNASIKQFPFNIVAGGFRFDVKSYFENQAEIN